MMLAGQPPGDDLTPDHVDEGARFDAPLANGLLAGMAGVAGEIVQLLVRLNVSSVGQ